MNLIEFRKEKVVVVDILTEGYMAKFWRVNKHNRL